MTIPRIVGLMLVLACVGVALVAIRAERAASNWRIQELQFQANEMRRRLWAQEDELARLRSIPEVRQQAERLNVEAAGGSGPAGRAGSSRR